MRKSKKGITLVELVICCTIIVLLGGACSAVLASGATIFNQSTSTANAQLDAEVLQSFMMNLIPSTHDVSQISVDEAKALADGSCLYFDSENDGKFTVQVDGKKTTIRSIKEFEYEIVRAGDPASDTARAQLKYTVHLVGGSKMEGGFVLSNVKFTAPDFTGKAKVSENPLCFGDS